MFSRWMRRGLWFPEASSRCRTTRRCRPRRQAAGSSFTAQNEGQRPGVRQSSLIRASHVWPMGTLPVAAQFAAEVLVVFLCGEEDEIGVAVEEHVSAIVAVYPHDRREDVVLPVLHRPLRRIGACTVRAVELVLENVGAGSIGRRRSGQVMRRSGRVRPGLWEGDRGRQAGRSRTSTSCCDDPSEAREHPKGRTRSRARFTDGFCVSGSGGNLGAD